MNRRQLFQISGTVLAAALAGCVGDDDTTDDDTTDGNGAGNGTDDTGESRDEREINHLELDDLPGDGWENTWESDTGEELSYAWSPDTTGAIVINSVVASSANTSEEELLDDFEQEKNRVREDSDDFREVDIADRAYSSQFFDGSEIRVGTQFTDGNTWGAVALIYPTEDADPRNDIYEIDWPVETGMSQTEELARAMYS